MEIQPSTVYFDAYMFGETFGQDFEFSDGLTPEANRMLRDIFLSTLVSTTDVGVVIGSGAKEYAEREATARGLEQELMEPLHYRAPVPIECSRETAFIPRKVGEARGMYFARVVTAVADSGENELTIGLFQSLSMQLLLEQKLVDKEGKLVTEARYMGDKEINIEFSVLERIIEAGELTDLSQRELSALKGLLEGAKSLHTEMQELAQETNVYTVQAAIAERKTGRRLARFMRRAGAIACVAVASITLPAISELRHRPSDAVKEVALTDVRTLQGIEELEQKVAPNTDYEQIAQNVTDGVKDDLTRRLSNEHLKAADKDVLKEILIAAKETSVYLASIGDQQSSSQEKILETEGNLSAIEKKLQLPNTDWDVYLIVGGVTVAYSAFAIGLLRNASKNGGKLDPLRRKVLPAVQQGSIPHFYRYGRGVLIPTSTAIRSYNDSNIEEDSNRGI